MDWVCLWCNCGMRTTMDMAGRLVIPKALRDAVGLVAGEVDVSVSGSGLRIEQQAGEAVAEEGGLLVVPASGAAVGDDLVRALRDAAQR